MPATAGGAAPRGVAPRGGAPRDTALQRARRAPRTFSLCGRYSGFVAACPAGAMLREGARLLEILTPARRAAARGVPCQRDRNPGLRARPGRGDPRRGSALCCVHPFDGAAASKQRPPNGSTCRTYQVGKRINLHKAKIWSTGHQLVPFPFDYHFKLSN